MSFKWKINKDYKGARQVEQRIIKSMLVWQFEIEIDCVIKNMKNKRLFEQNTSSYFPSQNI